MFFSHIFRSIYRGASFYGISISNVLPFLSFFRVTGFYLFSHFIPVSIIVFDWIPFDCWSIMIWRCSAERGSFELIERNWTHGSSEERKNYFSSLFVNNFKIYFEYFKNTSRILVVAQIVTQFHGRTNLADKWKVQVNSINRSQCMNEVANHAARGSNTKGGDCLKCSSILSQSSTLPFFLAECPI